MLMIKDRYIAVEHIAMMKPDYEYSCLYIWFVTDGRPVELELDSNTELDEIIEFILNQKNGINNNIEKLKLLDVSFFED